MIEEVANECMATLPDGHLLAEHYEALRREAVDASEYHARVRSRRYASALGRSRYSATW